MIIYFRIFLIDPEKTYSLGFTLSGLGGGGEAGGKQDMLKLLIHPLYHFHIRGQQAAL